MKGIDDMKNLCDYPIVEKAKNAIKSLSKTRLKGEYSMNLSVYSEDTPEKNDASHKCQGTIDHSLTKIVLALGALAVFSSVICCVRSIFRD